MSKTITVATDEELLAEYNTWTPVIDLLGVDIRGRKAITTNPIYNYQYPQGVPVRTLIEVRQHKETNKGKQYTWTELFWEKEGNDCGFGGYREDCEYWPMRIKFVD